MAGFLGIDHPLVLLRDLDAGAARYEALGFAPRPIGYHPWGTSMRLVQFEGCSIELMSVYDESLIAAHPVGEFRFGRTIRDHLAEREGISLLALHSEDADGDAAIVEGRGTACQGGVQFGRDIALADGSRDRTRTTLKILADLALPRLSNFIVHQHRPDLIFRPEWQVHPNGASGIHQVTIMADEADWPRVGARLVGLYGDEAVRDHPGGFAAQTGNGRFVIMDRHGVAAEYSALPPDLLAETRPCCVAIHVTVADLDVARDHLERAGVAFRAAAGSLRLSDAAAYGNVFLAFATARP